LSKLKKNERKKKGKFLNNIKREGEKKKRGEKKRERERDNLKVK